MGNKGCKFLAKSSFIHLNVLNLVKNEIESAGMQHLKKAQWKKLSFLNLCKSINRKTTIGLARME